MAEGEPLRSKGECRKWRKLDFSNFDSDHFGQLLSILRDSFRYILVSFSDISFRMDFYVLSKWFFIEFDAV